VGVVPPLAGVAVKITVVPAQMVKPVLAVTVTPGVTVGLTVSVFVTELAVVGEAQVSDEVITTYTVSLLVGELRTYEALPDGPWTEVLFKNHSYVGEPPPLVGVAVKVKGVFAHTVKPGDTDKPTPGVSEEITEMVLVAEVAVAAVTQASDEVITTWNWSPFTGAFVVNVSAVAPEICTPLRYHW
jgi:hypothetical protein